jgi:hypothetical protein
MMPQLVKGAKWAFGWVVVTASGEVPIPPEAWLEYGFRAGDEAVLLLGSKASGGFAISTPQLLADLSWRLGNGDLWVCGRGRFSVRCSCASVPEMLVTPCDKLLAVRGSRYGLGYVARGRIYEEALQHADRLGIYGGAG